MEQKTTPSELTIPVQPNRPNEQGMLNVDDFLRIYDPETKQVFVEKRS